MADDADMADARIEAAVLEGIAAARRNAEIKHYYADCQWCGDPTEAGAKYCNRDCAADAHKYEATLKRVGIGK